jgi:hypothetical protein
MENFFNQKFSSYEEYIKESKKFQDEFFQVLVNRSTKNINSYDPDSKIFVYETIILVCKHSTDYKQNNLILVGQISILILQIVLSRHI